MVQASKRQKLGIGLHYYDRVMQLRPVALNPVAGSWRSIGVDGLSDHKLVTATLDFSELSQRLGGGYRPSGASVLKLSSSQASARQILACLLPQSLPGFCLPHGHATRMRVDMACLGSSR